MNIKNEITAKMAEAGYKGPAVVEEMNKRGYKISIDVFYRKLKNETLRYNEAIMIADIIGKKIEWTDKKS